MAVVAAASAWAGQAPAPLTPAQLKAPCVELITPAEVRELGRKDVLTRVSHDTPGSSLCSWEAPPDQTFVIGRQTAEWFKYEQVSGPKESFDLNRHGYDATVGTDPVPNLGIEARVTRHKEMPTVMVRRAADVVYVWCAGCTREQAIAVARKAITP
jgi:hypothetical protein